MKAFESYKNLPDGVKGNVVAIGNFDGVHHGHKALLQKTKTIAQEFNCQTIVVTFDPHPRQLFKPNDPPFRLTNKEIKAQDLFNHGVDHVISIPFDKAFSQKTAETFINDILVDGLAARHIVVGDDFIFGYQRGGSIETLKTDGRFGVTALAQVTTDNHAIYGSSLIRHALKLGDLATARDHLGRYWTTQAIVIHGNKRGREIGYPTANMQLGDFIHPAYGVYAVRAKTQDSVWINGVANFGIRPMFEVPEPLLEVHLFDFDSDLYEQTLTVEWISYLRGEMKFDSLTALIQQMNGDSARAKDILANL